MRPAGSALGVRHDAVDRSFSDAIIIRERITE
jgi:hypothetical protein